MKKLVGFILLTAIVAVYVPKYVGGILHVKDTAIVENMKSCLKERKAQSVTEEQIGYSHRLCWMRASRG